MKLRLLGGLSPREFLRRHWQKRPLFVPGALPGFTGLIERRELAALAMRDDVESRIVERRGRRWHTRHGPFAAIRTKSRNWTLLVSGVNLHSPAADALLRRFSFIPQARLDDVMVSCAVPGGGVGPHVDSYDVFLLQGEGHRLWRAGKSVYRAAPGDLLYLPPGVEHDGVAQDLCTTYSIGFRAPRGAELGAAFLDWLHEHGLPDAVYRDPGLAPVGYPARVPPEMIGFAFETLKRIRFSKQDVIEFLGRYLSAPKPYVVFRRTRSRGGVVRLDSKTQLLYSGGTFFMNGEAFSPRGGAALRELADKRELARARLAPVAQLIAEWQRAGYLHFTPKAQRDG